MEVRYGKGPEEGIVSAPVQVSFGAVRVAAAARCPRLASEDESAGGDAEAASAPGPGGVFEGRPKDAGPEAQTIRKRATAPRKCAFSIPDPGNPVGGASEAPPRKRWVPIRPFTLSKLFFF